MCHHLRNCMEVNDITKNVKVLLLKGRSPPKSAADCPTANQLRRPHCFRVAAQSLKQELCIPNCTSANLGLSSYEDHVRDGVTEEGDGVKSILCKTWPFMLWFVQSKRLKCLCPIIL